MSPDDPDLVLSVSPEADESALVSVALNCQLGLVTQVVLRARSTKDLCCRLVGVDYKPVDSQSFCPVKQLHVPREEDRLDMEYADAVMLFPAICVTATLRLTFQCDRPEWDDLDQEVAAISNRMSHDRHWAERIFKDSFGSVGVLGYSLLSPQEAGHALGLINLVQVLGDMDEAREACYLTGLALIGDKKCTQAAEFLRRAEMMALKGVNVQKAVSTNSQRPVNTVVNLKIWYAVRLEIVIADGFAQTGLYKQQIQALQRAVDLQQGSIAVSNCQGSLLSCLARLNPTLTRILMKCLSDHAEPIRVSALRLLRAVVELLGCSLGSALATILKAVVRAYHIHPSLQTDLFNNSTLTNISFTDIIFKEDAALGSANEYLKLIQTIRTLLSDCSPHLLQKLFAEGVTPLTMMDMKKDLKHEILRLAGRIAELMQGDLEVDLALLKHVFSLRDVDDFQEAANSLWRILSNCVLRHYNGSDLVGLLEWLREAMAPDCGTDVATEGLQLISAIAKSTSIMKPELARMKATLEHWLQFALFTPGQMQLYEQTWSCLVDLSMHVPRLDLARTLKHILERTVMVLGQAGIQAETLQFLKLTLPDIPCKEPIIPVLNSLLIVLFSAYPSRYEAQLLDISSLIISKLGVYLQAETVRAAAETLYSEQTTGSEQVLRTRAELLQACMSPGLLEAAVQTSVLDSSVQAQPGLLTFAVALLEKCGPGQQLSIASLSEQLCNACDLLLINEDPLLKTSALRCLRAMLRIGASGKPADRIDTAMLVLGSLRVVLEADSDVDMLFLALQLLYQVFSDLVPASSEKRFADFRASETVKLWQLVTKCIDSGWTSISTYSAAILRNWAWGCSAKVGKLLFAYILPLANAKDCFRRDLFLCVLASFLGLGTLAVHVPPAIWEGAFALQQDWNTDIRSKAKGLMSRCAPKEVAKELSSRQQQKLALLADSSQYDLTCEEEEEVSCDFPLKEESIVCPDLTVLFRTVSLPNSLRESKEQSSCIKSETADLNVDLNEPPECLERPQLDSKKPAEMLSRKEEKPQPPPEAKSEESRIRAPPKPMEDSQPAPLKATDSKRSPRTPRKSLEQELELALRPHAGVPPAELMTKIYLQRPDMTLFRRKTKSASLTSSAGRTRKVVSRPQRPSPVFKEH